VGHSHRDLSHPWSPPMQVIWSGMRAADQPLRNTEWTREESEGRGRTRSSPSLSQSPTEGLVPADNTATGHTPPLPGGARLVPVRDERHVTAIWRASIVVLEERGVASRARRPQRHRRERRCRVCRASFDLRAREGRGREWRGGGHGMFHSCRSRAREISSNA